MSNLTESIDIRVVSSLEKVFPDEAPSAEADITGVSAFWGESTSFQVAYNYSSLFAKWTDVEVSSEIADHIRVRKVELVPSTYPRHGLYDEDYLRTAPGMYPDLLRELSDNKIKLIPDQWRCLWVEIDVTENIPEGEYPVKIEFINESGEVEAEAETFVEVIGIKLPELRIKHTEWFHGDCLADYYGIEVFSERHWEIMENFIATAVRRNCNMLLIPIFTPPLDTAVGGERTTIQLVDVRVDSGEYSFGFGKLKIFIDICLAQGIRYFEMAHLFTQWGAQAAPKIMATVDGEYKRIFGWDTPATGGKYEEFLQLFLPQLTETLAGWGLQDRVYFHISDEPVKENIESYSKAKELVSPYLEGFNTMDAISDYEFYERGLIEQPVCGNDHIEPFLENNVENLWTYYCTAQWKDVSNRFMAMPSYRNRIIGVQLYKYDITGFLHWGYNFYNSQFSLEHINPYEDTSASEAFPSGDTFLVYPGADGKPEESIRILVLSQAFDDYRAMQLLEEISGREKVLELIEDTDSEISFTEYPRSASYLLNLREKLNDAIKASR